MRLLQWQYEKQNLAPPPAGELARQAARVVDDAHRIARQRGRNVMAIVRDLVAELRGKQG